VKSSKNEPYVVSAFRRTPLVLTLSSLCVALTLHAQVLPRPAAIDFERDVRPILQQNCYECHDARKQKARLRLDSPAAIMKGSENGAIVVPGNSEKSPMVRRLLGLDGEDRMPKDKDPLPPAQIALIAMVEAGRLSTIVPDSYAAMLPRGGRAAVASIRDIISPSSVGLIVRNRHPLGPLSAAALIVARGMKPHLQKRIDRKPLSLIG